MLPRSKLLDVVNGGMHGILLHNEEPGRPWIGVGQLTVNAMRKVGSILPMSDWDRFRDLYISRVPFGFPTRTHVFISFPFVISRETRGYSRQ